MADGSVDKKLKNATQAISQVLQPEEKKVKVIVPEKPSEVEEKKD